MIEVNGTELALSRPPASGSWASSTSYWGGSGMASEGLRAHRPLHTDLPGGGARRSIRRACRLGST